MSTTTAAAAAVATVVDSTGDTTNAPPLTGGFAEKSRKRAKKTHDRKSNTSGVESVVDHITQSPATLVGDAVNHVSPESSNRHIVIDESMPSVATIKAVSSSERKKPDITNITTAGSSTTVVTEPSISRRRQSIATPPHQPSYAAEFHVKQPSIIYRGGGYNNDDDNDDDTTTSTNFSGAHLDIRDISTLYQLTPQTLTSQPQSSVHVNGSRSNSKATVNTTTTTTITPDDTMETDTPSTSCNHSKVFVCHDTLLNTSDEEKTRHRTNAVIFATSISHAKAMMNKRIIQRNATDDIERYVFTELDSTKLAVHMMTDAVVAANTITVGVLGDGNGSESNRDK